jgi:hypothetical protein
MVGGPVFVFMQSGESNTMILSSSELHVAAIVVPFFLIPTDYVHITASMEPTGTSKVDEPVTFRVRYGGTIQDVDGTLIASGSVGVTDNDGTLTATIANPGGTQNVKFTVQGTGVAVHSPANQMLIVRPA